MCYTEKDSLIAYIINFITSILLFNYSNDENLKIYALFFMFVGQMQIFDYIFWKNQECNKINNLTTKLAIIFNHLQPIILLFLQYIYNFEISMISIITLITYLIFGIKYSIEALKNVNCTLPHNNILDWQWNKQQNAFSFYFLFLLSLTVFSFNFKTTSFKYLSALINIISFIIASKTPILNYSIGRIWCYYASLIPLFLTIFIS